jgi:hypothetical protein
MFISNFLESKEQGARFRNWKKLYPLIKYTILGSESLRKIGNHGGVGIPRIQLFGIWIHSTAQQGEQ